MSYYIIVAPIAVFELPCYTGSWPAEEYRRRKAENDALATMCKDDDFPRLVVPAEAEPLACWLRRRIEDVHTGHVNPDSKVPFGSGEVQAYRLAPNANYSSRPYETAKLAEPPLLKRLEDPAVWKQARGQLKTDPLCALFRVASLGPQRSELTVVSEWPEVWWYLQGLIGELETVWPDTSRVRWPAEAQPSLAGGSQPVVKGEPEEEPTARGKPKRRPLLEEDPERWEYIAGKVTEYRAWRKKGLSTTAAASKVKDAFGKSIPRSTLMDWERRVDTLTA